MMQLLLEHAQRGKFFRLWAKYELLEQEQELVERYGIRPFILVQGNVRHDRERAMKLAAVLAVIAGLIALPFGPPPMAVTVAVITFILGSIGVYNNIK